ncbi:MAG: hypothetical protein ACRDVL_13465 [Acidimicrobiia bacterium]
MVDESRLQQRLIELQRKLLGVRWDLDEVDQQIRLIESRAMVRVAEARDERGSPLYSTQEVRRAAMTAQLAEDDDYAAFRDRRRHLKREADLLVLDIREVQTQLPPEWPPGL